MELSELSQSNISPFKTFEEAVQAVLEFLHSHIGFQLWMFTRVEGDDWIVLAAADFGYNVSAGDVFRWSDSFCSRMVQGLGPRLAPKSDDVPAYAEAPIGRQVPIGAYIGLPVYQADGELFGTLCAIDPEPQPEQIDHYLSLLDLQSRLLTTILQAELEAQKRQRTLERLEAESQLDSMTGLFNRRAWDRLLELEEERCKRYGGNAIVVVIDLDDLKQTNDTQGHLAGDCLLKMTAQVLRASVRTNDVIARLGGDEFSILLVESTLDDTAKFVARIRERLEKSSIQASLGWAIRSHASNLIETFQVADRAMYQEKQLRRELKYRLQLKNSATSDS